MNDMRKLMETVESLYEDQSVGFKNVVVGGDNDDITVDGKPLAVKTIWIYDNSVMNDFSQKDFGRTDSVSDEEYKAILDSVVDSVEREVKSAINERDPWSDNDKDYYHNYIAIGADVNKDIDDKLVKDVIKWTSLDNHYGPTKNDDGSFDVFEIIRPKKKRWWNK